MSTHTATPKAKAATSRKITTTDPTGKRAIYFPAATVDLLKELLEASGTLLSTAQYAEEFLQQEILASLVPRSCGVPEVLAGSYQLAPGDMEAMQAVVARWKGKAAASA